MKDNTNDRDKENVSETSSANPSPSNQQGETTRPHPTSLLEPELAEAVSKLPEPMRKSIELSMISMMHGVSRTGNPLLEKLEPEHITKLLQYDHEENRMQLSIKSTNRLYALFYALICIIFFGFLVVYLADKHSAILLDILKIFVGFLGGLGGGYGLKAYLDKKTDA